MIQNKVQVSTPGNPDGALNAFNVAYGSGPPSTPTGQGTGLVSLAAAPRAAGRS
ncbi:MAG TPA: hypothetical protein VHZ05_13330 [Acidimicrobiales bacterium]|nr:hypothetical protein [Acidimicrobiales bacterium]